MNCLKNSLLFITIFCFQNAFGQFEKISIRNTSIEYEKDLLEDSTYDYVKLMLCGDIVHKNHLLKKYVAKDAQNNYSYRSWFRSIKPLFFYPDFVVGSLKSFFPPRAQMTTYENSAPDEMLGELGYTGFNVMMMANSSSLTDRKIVNDVTLRKIHEMDMFKVGYYRDSHEKAANYPLVLEKKDIRIAFLNYSLDSILLDIGNENISFFNIDSIRKDIIKCKKKMQVDYIVTYIDWAGQDSLKLGKVAELLNMGIDVIIGTGSGEAFTNADIMTYSDGSLKLHVDNIGYFNAISNERQRNKTAAIEIVLKKDKTSKQVSLHDMGFIPLWTLIDHERYSVLPISNIEEKHIKDVNLNLIQYSTMKVALTDLRFAFFDKIPELHYDYTDKTVNAVEMTSYIRNTLLKEQDKINQKLVAQNEKEFEELFGKPQAIGSMHIPYEDDQGMARSKKINQKNSSSDNSTHAYYESDSGKKKQNFGQKRGSKTSILSSDYEGMVRDTYEYYGVNDEMSDKGIVNIKSNHEYYQREKVRLLTPQEKHERDSIKKYNARFMVNDETEKIKYELRKKKAEARRLQDSIVKASFKPNYKSSYNPAVEVQTVGTEHKPIKSSGIFTSYEETKKSDESPVKVIEEYFLVQIQTMTKQSPIDIEKYPYLIGYEARYEEGYYRYYVGRTNSQNLAIEMCKIIRSKGHNDAIIVKYTNGVRTVFKSNF